MFQFDPLIMEVVAGAAALLTTIAFVPQAVKIWRSKSARDLSLAMYSILWVGIGLWVAYGLYIGSIGMIVGNVITWLLASSILYVIVRYG